jgi:integrase
MARKIKSRLASVSARLAFPVRGKPYDFTNVGDGIAVGYRKTQHAGSWVLRKAATKIDEKTGEIKDATWTERIGPADDYEEADGIHTFDFWQACERARQMARGTSADAPATFAAALDGYAEDLKMRGGNPANAGMVRCHLRQHPALINKPVSLLTAKELTGWRNALLKSGVKPATALRVFKSAKAALNLAAKLDPRIQNRNAWRDGLSGVKIENEPENRVLSDAQVITLVAAAYALRSDFGLFIDVLAVTGTRTSQACRLTVRDLQAENGSPRLMMPPSRKGKKREIGNRSVPITRSLAEKLKAAANGRAGHEALLRRFDGSAWNSKSQELNELFGTIAKSSGVGGTAYQLRHSSIVRALLSGVPIRIVAVSHDTSVGQIEQTYSHHIDDHADAVARQGLLDTEAPIEDDVVVNLRVR